jgi:hypothetical protein
MQMDTLAHYLWTVAMYWQHRWSWLVGLLGAAPDLLSLGPLFVLGPLGLRHLWPWARELYLFTHSLVVFALVASVLWFFAREWFFLSLGWALHIIIDIPTHSASFYPTPFLWPISTYAWDGIRWGTGWYWALTWAALALVYGVLIWNSVKTSRPAVR